MRRLVQFRYYSRLFWRKQKEWVMSKTETALIVLVMLILAFGIWFIFSGAIWSFVSYFETLLYPELHTPK
ncbi:hypothetical protein LG71_26275 [Pluralibacter gergoviae]|nr:hypothetical protein LG71_26275 [Pluralibacter gergoviae]